jgi:phosphoserine aminotransferase
LHLLAESIFVESVLAEIYPNLPTFDKPITFVIISASKMNPKTFFTPGPAAMYPTFYQHLTQALADDIPSISHRSNQFRSIYQDTFEALKELFNLPDGFGVFFTGSATEIWERLLQNCVEDTSFHLVNGAFSSKFHEFAELLQRTALKQEVEFGKGFSIEDIKIDYKAELIAFTHNETSSGVMTSPDTIQHIKAQNPNRLVVVDMVSSAPYPTFDFNQIDSAFFSVQKAFGLPAGLGVWIVNEKCLAKAEAIEKERSTGTYHRLSNLWKFFERFETPATPNVLGIYLLGKIATDMLEKGIDTIREETDVKAIMLYDFLRESEHFEVFVRNSEHQSPTVIVADTTLPAKQVIDTLVAQNIIIGSGYDKSREQIRIANFPAVSIEDTERLIEALTNLA